MQGKTVAFLESRLADHVAELVRRRGGSPISAPALAEEPDVDPVTIADVISTCSAERAKAVVFQTGVGTRALFATVDQLGLTATLRELLERTTVVVRGPKPTAVLRQAHVRIDLSAAEPYTTAEVLAAMAPLQLRGELVVVQRYGDANLELHDALRARGAVIVEVPTYRWALPKDTA